MHDAAAGVEEDVPAAQTVQDEDPDESAKEPAGRERVRDYGEKISGGVEGETGEEGRGWNGRNSGGGR